MNFSGPGSALTFSEDKDTDKEEPSTQAPESPKPSETVAPPTPTDVPSPPQSPAPQDNSSPPPPTPTNTPPGEGNSAHTKAGGTSIEGNSINVANAVTAPGSGGHTQPRLMRTLDVGDIDTADGQQQLLTADTAQDASALSMTTQTSTLAAPVNPVGALLAMPTAIINIAAGVVAAFLSPFLAPGPASPAEPPLLWAVLAFVRREVQRTFFNRSPVANDNAYTTSEDNGLSGNVLTDGVDDTDADGDPLTATIVTGPQHGTLVLNPNGSFTYTPTADYSGTDTFTYKVSDETGRFHMHGLLGFLTNSGHSDTATVSITVHAVNHPPVASDDIATAAEDTAVSINVLANDSDPDGNPLTLVPVSTPTNGTLVKTANGWTYTPNANFNGSDSFSYKVNDGIADSNTATVSVTITPVEDPPATPDVTENVDTGVAIPINLLTIVSDPDGDTVSIKQLVIRTGPNTITINAFAGGGTIDVATAYLTLHLPSAANPGIFTVTAVFPGTITVDYLATDGKAERTGTLTLSATFVNEDPVANPDTYQATEDTALVAQPFPQSVLFNDFDADDQGLNVANPGTITTTEGGSVVITTDGTFTYNPKPNFSGIDTFTYTVTDGFGGTAIGHVTINVAAVNDAPVSVDDSYTMTEDGTLTGKVTTNDTDLETGDIWVVGPYTPPAHGMLSFQFDGSFTYAPNPNFTGTDTFTYKAWDRDPVLLGNLATVTITVIPVDDAPVANDDAFTIDEDNTLIDTVLGNDTDPDNVLTATVVTAPTNGSLSLNTNGSFTYIPNANYSGPDSFIYRITGGTLEDTATVSITVNAVNDAPVSVDDNYTTANDTVLTGKVTTNDTDLETADIWVVGPYTPPAHGTLSFQFDGSFTYTPNPGFTGTDIFTYKAWDRDPVILGNLATVTITVSAANQAPVAVNDTITTTEDNFTTAGNVLTNDTDAEGNPLTIVDPGVITTAHGAVVLQSDGTFSYAPIPNFNGQDSFKYRVSDGTATSNLATVTINVTPVNDAPVALPNAYVATGSFTSSNRSVSGNVITDTPADFDVDGGSLTAVLVDPPNKHNNGVFVLNSNGSFSYRANRLAGTDSFSYYVTDGVTNSNTIIVGIVINPA
jgi:VCBS repeat-containing protein